MRARHWQALCFVVFFAAFVPAALACEVSSHSHAACTEVGCERPAQLVNCSGVAALGSGALSKSPHDAPKITVLYVLPSPLTVWNPSSLRRLNVPILAVKAAHQRSTLFEQSVLLQI